MTNLILKTLDLAEEEIANLEIENMKITVLYLERCKSAAIMEAALHAVLDRVAKAANNANPRIPIKDVDAFLVWVAETANAGLGRSKRS